jgi:hypothetical protein
MYVVQTSLIDKQGSQYVLICRYYKPSHLTTPLKERVKKINHDPLSCMSVVEEAVNIDTNP